MGLGNPIYFQNGLKDNLDTSVSDNRQAFGLQLFFISFFTCSLQNGGRIANPPAAGMKQRQPICTYTDSFVKAGAGSVLDALILALPLQDSLGGKSHTALIVCCSPSAIDASESLASLRFAARAAGVVNTSQVSKNLARKTGESPEEKLL